MPLKTIYIARHGFRLNWETTIWKSRTGFPRDPPLSAHGDHQATELAAYITSLPEHERPTAIYSSPYYRCLQTANPTATSLKIPIYVEHAIGEWYSPVKAETGLHPRPVSAEELVPYFDTIDPSWTPTYLVTRKGELVPALYKRAEDFLKAFIERVETNSIGGGHERVLLFSHAATVIALAQALLQDQSIGRTLRVGCCTLSIFDRKSNVDGDNSIVLGGSIWEPRGELAFASFLTKGVERDWGMNDIDAIDGVVVEDRGVPGTEGEEDIVSGVQPWKASGTAKM